jgi:hypothetical protein
VTYLYQQYILIDYTGQAALELRFRYGAFSGHKIEYLTGSVSGNQEANLIKR